MRDRNGSLLSCVAVSAATVVCALPRFNRADSIFGVSIRRLTSSSSGDSDQYIALVEHYRGHAATVDAPFAFRPLAPWLASRLPAEPMTSLNVIFMLSLFLASACVFATARKVLEDTRAATLAGLLFGVSFPVFYYGAIGQVDTLSIGLCAASVALCVHEHLVASALVFFLAMLAKETSITVAPFLLLWTFQRSRRSAAWLAVGLLSAFVLSSHLVHKVFAPPSASAYGWAPNVGRLLRNLVRPRVYATFLLGIGLQGALHVLVAARDKQRSVLARLLDPWTVGFVTSLALFAFALATAWADARFLWSGQLFTSVTAAGFLAARSRAPATSR